MAGTPTPLLPAMRALAFSNQVFCGLALPERGPLSLSSRRQKKPHTALTCLDQDPNAAAAAKDEDRARLAKRTTAAQAAAAHGLDEVSRAFPALAERVVDASWSAAYLLSFQKRLHHRLSLLVRLGSRIRRKV